MNAREGEAGLHDVTVPELGFIAGTRAAAGVGLGLLIAERFSRTERIALGCILLTIGAVTTVPIFLRVFGKPAISEAFD